MPSIEAKFHPLQKNISSFVRWNSFVGRRCTDRLTNCAGIREDKGKAALIDDISLGRTLDAITRGTSGCSFSFPLIHFFGDGYRPSPNSIPRGSDTTLIKRNNVCLWQNQPRLRADKFVPCWKHYLVACIRSLNWKTALWSPQSFQTRLQDGGC